MVVTRRYLAPSFSFIFLPYSHEGVDNGQHDLFIHFLLEIKEQTNLQKNEEVETKITSKNNKVR